MIEVDQSGGLTGVRKGIAGKIMQRWGGACSASSSDTLLAVVEGQQPNRAGTGIGWVGEKRARGNMEQASESSTWSKIGSIFDAPQIGDTEMRSRRAPLPRSTNVMGSFRLSQTRGQCESICFVAATDAGP